MSGSRTIRVLKRDGRTEDFNRGKLACAMWRAMRGTGTRRSDARELASAVAIYLDSKSKYTVSSSAVFEMGLKVFRRVAMYPAAKVFEAHRVWRDDGRKALRVAHESGRETRWDKGWLAEVISHSWHIQLEVSRILAGEVENRVLQERRETISRLEVLDIANETVASYGLADAVPVAL